MIVLTFDLRFLDLVVCSLFLFMMDLLFVIDSQLFQPSFLGFTIHGWSNLFLCVLLLFQINHGCATCVRSLHWLIFCLLSLNHEVLWWLCLCDCVLRAARWACVCHWGLCAVSWACVCNCMWCAARCACVRSSTHLLQTASFVLHQHLRNHDDAQWRSCFEDPC